MIRILAAVCAGLFGLVFGSFLNVCLSRWPAGESIVHPRSHCGQCGRTLAWWENLPLLSWLALGGRCRTCRAWIGWRHPLVEAAVGVLWAAQMWSLSDRFFTDLLGMMIFSWLLVALALLDAEHFWLPDFLTLPGVALGVLYSVVLEAQRRPEPDLLHAAGRAFAGRFIAILAAAGVILLIRWLYRLLRHREGLGLGDAKLMALLAAWLGLPGALLAFLLAVVLGALAAVVLLATPSARRSSEGWAASKLPLGTFLCLGGIVSSLWGQPMIAAYLRCAGF